MSNHFDRNKQSLYNEYSASFNAQYLNEISNPKILYNYYLCLLFENRISPLENATSRLEKISNRIFDLAPNGFESNYIQYLQHHGTEDGLSFLKKAYDLEPLEVEIWDEMLGYYVTIGDEFRAKVLAKKIKQSGKYHPDIYKYQRNVIASTEGNAILFVNGELDTYPLLVLHYTERFKHNVVVICHELLSYISYQRIIAEKIGSSNKIGNSISTQFMDKLENEHLGYNMYLALTMDKDILNSLKRNLYLSGLTFEYSSKSIDNISLCENNFDIKMNLSHLFDKSLKPIEIRDLNRNYIPILNFLEKYSTDLSQESANRIKALKSVILQSLPNQ